MAELEYSAGMVSQVFAFVETKKTAELIVQGFSMLYEGGLTVERKYFRRIKP